MKCKVKIIRSNVLYENPYQIIDGATFPDRATAQKAVDICSRIFNDHYWSEGAHVFVGFGDVKEEV